jgi:hypothetical protein
MDISLTVKRAIIWAVSFVTAFVLTFVLVYVVLGTNIEKFSNAYFVLTAVPIGFVFLIWGDLLLGTKILPD